MNDIRAQGGSSDKPSEEIRKYVHHCRALERDIDNVLEDYRVSTATKKWTIHYAVDFSEIFAYVLPEETHETAPFPDGWVTGDRLQQYYILARFFGRQKVILPEPYAVELRSFYDRLVTRSIVTVLEDMAGAVEDMKKLVASADSEEILRLAEEQRARNLSTKEVQKTISFFEKNALLLVASARGVRLEPFERLRRLLAERKFVSLESIVGSKIDLDERYVEERFNALQRRRGGASHPAASLVDARAIEQIRVANKKLAQQKIAIRLVTRSQHMASVVAESSHLPGWEDVRPFVRHPRIFSAAYLPAAGLTAEFVKLLESRGESLSLFIRTANDALRQRPGHLDGEHPDEQQQTAILTQIRAMIGRIRDDWSNAEQLASTLSADGEQHFKETDPETIARRLLQFVRERQELSKRVRERIRQIFRDARRGLGVLGVRLQSASSETVSHGSIIYPIEFITPALTDEIAGLADLWSVSVAAAEALFEVASADGTPDYDLFLALAVSLGAIGSWSIARRYADMAIAQAEADKLPAHEAQFFSALCMRKALDESDAPDHVVSQIENAIQRIESAIRIRRQRHPDSSEDPRYLNELAVLKMWALRSGRTVGREEIENILERVLAVAPLREKLQLQALNNLTYLHLMPPMNAEKAQHHLRMLEQRLTEKGYTRAEWPPFILDTIDYANFRLRRDADVATLKDWLEELRSVVKHAHLSPREKEWVRSHLADIRDALRKKEPGPDQG